MTPICNIISDIESIVPTRVYEEGLHAYLLMVAEKDTKLTTCEWYLYATFEQAEKLYQTIAEGVFTKGVFSKKASEDLNLPNIRDIHLVELQRVLVGSDTNSTEQLNTQWIKSCTHNFELYNEL